MKRLFQQGLNESPADELAAREPTRHTKSDGLSRKQLLIGAIALSIFLLCLCAYWVIDTLTVGTKAAMDAFTEAKEQSAEEVYQYFYDTSYVAAEKAHHVSNDVSITIGDLREEQKLEVLKISDVAYETPRPTDQNWFASFIEGITGIFDAEVVSWLEVPGNGVFTINLQAGEFIIDDERQYVLIRVPNPELTSFSIDYENVELLLFDKGGAFKNSAKYGVDKANEQLASAELTMMQNANNNQTFYQQARESTEKMLINLVKQLNPQLPDLTVQIEFID